MPRARVRCITAIGMFVMAMASSSGTATIHAWGDIRIALGNQTVYSVEVPFSDNARFLELGTIRPFEILYNEDCCQLQASASATANAAFGVNRSMAVGTASAANPAMGTVFLATGSAAANSEWSDTWVLQGDRAGFGHIVVSGIVEGDLSVPVTIGPLSAESVAGTVSAGFGFTAGAGGPAKSEGVAIAENLAIGGNRSIHRAWTLFIDAPYNQPFQVTSTLGTTVQSAGAAAFLGTARFGRIEIPEGATLSSESGQLFANDGAYGYAAAVPEPEVLGLVCLGMAMLLPAATRRFDRAK